MTVYMVQYQYQSNPNPAGWWSYEIVFDDIQNAQNMASYLESQGNRVRIVAMNVTVEDRDVPDT